jgi:hypothetical protein
MVLQHCWGRDDPALRGSFRGGEPSVFLQETRFQPFPEQLPVHGDVRHQPIVADSIKRLSNMMPPSRIRLSSIPK